VNGTKRGLFATVSNADVDPALVSKLPSPIKLLALTIDAAVILLAVIVSALIILALIVPREVKFAVVILLEATISLAVIVLSTAAFPVSVRFKPLLLPLVFMAPLKVTGPLNVSVPANVLLLEVLAASSSILLVVTRHVLNESDNATLATTAPR
jgi:hypothetical protein